MQVTRQTLLAAASIAALVGGATKSPDLAFVTFGGDTTTRQRLEGLSERPSFDEIVQALDIPEDAVVMLEGLANSGISVGTLNKAVEQIQFSRKERDERIAREARLNQAKARGNESSYTSESFNLDTQAGVENAIKAVARALKSKGFDLSALLS